MNIFAIFHDQRVNDSLTNVIASFEQLGPVQYTVRIVSAMPNKIDVISTQLFLRTSRINWNKKKSEKSIIPQ